LFGITARNGDPAACAPQFFTFDFDVAAGFELALNYLSRPDKIQGPASARADAERLSCHRIFGQVQLSGVGTICRKPAKGNNQADKDQFTHR